MTDISASKPEQQRQMLRRRLRSARSALSSAEVATRSQAINHRLLPLISHARHLAGYVALGSEVDLSSLVSDTLKNANRCFYVPVVQAENLMAFARLRQDSLWVKNQYGILEPDVPKSDHIDTRTLDVVLVPLVGFDSLCNRMGMGGGYYDRAFAHRHKSAPNSGTQTGSKPETGIRTDINKPLLIGVAYDMQQAESVLPDWWDVPLDHVVTETRVLNRPTKGS